MSSEMQLGVQQWQIYNPLDKNNKISTLPISNKLPYSRTSPRLSKEALLHPKVTTVGVCPPRNSLEIEDLNVIMVGESVNDLHQPMNIIEKDNSKPPSQLPPIQNCMETTSTPAKLPAILNSEGTTSRPCFTFRPKPPLMLRSRLKRRREVKPIAVTTSVTSEKHGTSETHDNQTVITTPSIHEQAAAEGVRSAISVEITDTSSPVRSIDDMVQNLRSSRQTSATEKSLSDKKIDDLLQQVMSHAQEWISDTQSKGSSEVDRMEEDVVSSHSYQASDVPEEESSITDEESAIDDPIIREKRIMFDKDLDVSDTVSTLASQLSIPAGIPDVTTILTRKLSHAAIRGQSAIPSEMSSPVMMVMQDDEESVDYDQARQDLNMSLDVKNDDILNVLGENPPLIEKPAVIFKKEKDSYGVQGSGDSPYSYTTGGRIHRLCLLPSINELNVTPKELVLSKVTHTTSEVDITSQGDAGYFGSNQKKVAIKEELRGEYDERRNSNHQADYLDSSKLDPLDIDGWRRLVEGTFTKEDYTLEGERTDTSDWAAWRLLWTVVPPKMALSTSAVKALIFPYYHGTQMPLEERPEEEDWDVDDNLSDIVVEDKKKTEFNKKTLNRRHYSMQNLTKIGDEEEFHARVRHRSASMPNIRTNAVDDLAYNWVKIDYKAGMSDVRQQREFVLQQQLKEQSAATDEAGRLPTGSVADVGSSESLTRSQVLFTVPSTAPSNLLKEPAARKAGLGPDARLVGRRSFVIYDKKKQKRRKSKKFIQNIRKALLSYTPRSLVRSQSYESFLPIKSRERSRSAHAMERKQGKLHGKLTRSTSVPHYDQFDWFISRYQKYGEKIDDMREWVRDIWNVWFDEVYPPETDEESSLSEDVDFGVEMDTVMSDGETAKQKADIKKLVIPDVLPPVLLTIPEDDTEDEPEETLRSRVIDLTKDLDKLGVDKTSRRACLLARRGAFYRRLGEIKKACHDLDEAIELEPRLASAYWQRHLIRLLKNQKHEALDDLNAFLKIDPKNVNGYRSRADIFAILGDFTMAIVNLSQSIKLNPKDEEAYYQRAAIFEKTGDMLLAMEDYSAVVRLNPARTDALLKKALYHFNKRTWLSAVTDFSQLIRAEPQNAQARTYRGRAYAELCQHENALKDLSASVHLNPLNAVAFYHRGVLLRKAAPDKALQDLSVSLLLDNSEKNVLAVLHRGILYSEMKRYQEALADFEQTLRMDISIACAQVNIGLINMLVINNYWEAIKRFSLAIKGDPTYVRAYICRADAYAKVNKYRHAVNDITRAIRLSPTERHLYLRRGKFLLLLRELKLAAFCISHIATLEKGFVSTSATQQAVVQSFLGNHSEAVDTLSAACRSEPIPPMYVLLAKTLMKGKRFREAINNLRHALELSAFYMYGDASKTDIHFTPETAEMYFLLGQCHTEMYSLREALSAYNQALKINSSYAEAYYQRGLCRLKLDQPKGVQDLNRALAIKPDLFEAYLSRAAFYSTKQRYSKAILNCNEALSLRPKSIRALLCRGALKYRISAFYHAINDLTQAIDLDKKCALAYYNRAVCLHRTKKYHKALKDYSIVLVLTDGEESPANTSLRSQVFVNRALLYLHSDLHDASNAAGDLEEAILLKPNNTVILHTMALCYHKMKDLQGAHSAYTRCLEVDPFFLAAHVGRGDAFTDAGDFASAKLEYERALKLDPSCVDARVHLAYNLQMCGRLQQAWVQFTTAISLDPTCQSAFEGRAVTCLHAGDLQAASRDISTTLKCGNNTARVLTACGVVHQCQHDLYAAMTYYNKARKLDPTYTPAQFNAAVLYMRDRRFSDALECLQVVIRHNPTDSAAILNRGITRVLLNDTEGAMADFDYALQLDPYNAHIYYNRANLSFMLEDFDNAEKDYSAAFDINPSDYLTLKRRADAKGRLGRKEEAVYDYKESLIIFEQHQRLKALRAH